MIVGMADYVVPGAVIALATMFFRHILSKIERCECMTAEEFANYKYESSSATNLLSQEHVEAIALRRWKQVLAWVAFHSDQVSRVEDTNGHTALHHAALFRAPAHVMELILWAAPELASVPNKDGELALHWAVRLSTPQPILSLLLRAYPKGAFWPDNKGTTPLALIWERRQMSLLRSWRTETQTLLDETNVVWKRIMSVYRAQDVVQDDDVCDPQFQPLHLASPHPSPPCLFPLLIQVYGNQLKERDKNQRLPLAIACEYPEANRSYDVFTKVELILREFPAAASSFDQYSRRYPLHSALHSGILWNEGVEALIQAYPSALCVRDEATMLFPFMLAAAAGKQCNGKLDADRLAIDTVYNVLRSDPSVLRLCGY